ncbi:MAG: HEAT repeat domain-containing protein [Isosphaeraceae bacterium]
MNLESIRKFWLTLSLGLGLTLPAHAAPQDPAQKPATAQETQAEALAEYNALKAKLRPTAEGHWRLGLWCSAHGLPAEAEFHFSEVVRLDPKRDAAWKRLGYVRRQGRWVGPAELAAEKAQQEANRVWGPKIQALHNAHHDPKTREKALEELAAIDDPAAVPSVWNVFGKGGQGDQLLAVQLLTQIRSPASSQLLAVLAVFSPSATVRGRAIESLRDRDPDEYAAGLVALIRKPMRYEVRPVAGPGSAGVLTVEGEQVVVRRVYSAPSPRLNQRVGDGIKYVFTGNGALLDPYFDEARTNPAAAVASTMLTQAAWQNNVQESLRAANAAQQQMSADVDLIESLNVGILEANIRVGEVLRAAVGTVKGHDGRPVRAPDSGPGLDNDRNVWTAWLDAVKGRSSDPAKPEKPKKVVDQYVPLAYVPSFVSLFHYRPG